MKKTEYGLSISVDRPIHTKDRMSALLTGGLLILGVWGMGRSLLSPAVLTAALAVMLLLNLRGKWALPALTAAGAALLVLGFLRREAIASGLGAVGNGILGLLTAKTGYYYLKLETFGQTLEADAALGILLGTVVVLVAGIRNPLPMTALSGAVFLACGVGIFQPDLWLAVYLLGAAAMLAKNAAGERAVPVTIALAAVLGGLLLLGCRGIVMEPSEPVLGFIHRWRYEGSENPLPEGDLTNAGRFAPTEDAALEVTMAHWRGVYLRGFVGSVYTGRGWETASPEPADLLYTLQRDYFHPFAQLSAANSALEKASENHIAVRVLGACGAYGYLPYGIGGTELDANDLNTPRLDTYTGTLYPVEEAYLLQKELSDGAGQVEYRDAEAAYREWVYANCLEVPENIRDLLPASGDTLTTTEARELVLRWLHESLNYDEYAASGSDDAANALLTGSPRGWSIHYATLGALAMRNLGVPARYAEGYAVSRAEAAALGAGQTMTVTQEHAHAWVEYYLDGIGWLPFEVTPGRENEIVYQLPPDGNGLTEPEPDEPEPTEPEEPPVKQQPDPGSQTKLHMTKLVRDVILILLLAAVLGFLIRAAVLRRKLKAKLARFRRGSDRDTLLECLGYQWEIMETMGLSTGNLPLSGQEPEISRVLTGIDVGALLRTAQELCFSSHPVTMEQHVLVLEALDRTLAVWKRQTPTLKRFRLKWLRCQVL